MATAPKFIYPDGSGTTTQFVVTTNLPAFSVAAEVDSNTVDVQVDINGAGFVSDPTLFSLIPPNLYIPNPASFPNGLVLEKGQNTIRVRTVDLSGSVSPPSTVVVNVVDVVPSFTVNNPPTGLQVRRRATSADIMWSDVSTTGAVGYHVYASTGAGGTDSGYLRVNQEMIPASSPTEVSVDETPMISFDYDFRETNTDLEFQVQTQMADAITGEVVSKRSLTSWPLFASPEFRFRGSIIRLDTTRYFVFNHDRSASIGEGILNNDVFSSVSPDDPLFYVVTAVYYDKTTGELVESRYSPEMSASALPIDTSVRGIRIRDQRVITTDYIDEIQKGTPELSLIPGSTVREVHVEPFSNEMQKAYFLLDFVHRAKSFPALLAIDDPSLSGQSVSVTNSTYKQNLKTALSVADDSSVQALINGAFESLAQNRGISRKGRRAAVVEQTFYTTSKPTRDLVVQQNAVVSSSKNSAAPRFRSNGQFTLPVSQAQAFYNPDNRRYELKVQLVAETPGADGNVPAGDLDTVVSGASGFQTTNEVSADFGRDAQSNLDLAEEAMRSIVGVDSGTAGGYEKVATSTPGAFEVKVVRSGDAYMMRDWDPIRQKHTGGKVDVYVKGTIERTIDETFAFQFTLAKSVRFDVIDPVNLVFRARDSRLTPSNPIQEMLDNQAQGLGLRNHSNYPTTSYDLTGVTIVDYRTIRLSTLIPQPTTTLDDFVEGDYRYRSNNRFVPSVQPVRRVVSVTGEISGALSNDGGYSLYKTQDPLLNGESTIARDYVIINQVGNVPSGVAIPINDEQHVLIGEFEEPLKSVGVNAFSLQVLSQDRTIVYNGPGTANPDYFIVDGGQTKPLKIVRSGTSTIQSGEVVSVDYLHDENFRVTYVVNDVLQQMQNKISKSKHATADVLVKQAVENPMSTEASIQLKPNAIQAVTDSQIRTSISLLTDTKGIGESIYQTDISSSMKSVSSVDFIVQPFTKMTLRDGALRVRDTLPSSSYTFLASLSKFSNAVYIIEEPLPFNTMDSGGPSTSHTGVYMDNLIMTMASSMEAVSDFFGSAWIIGRFGAIIPGFSDDATLIPLVGSAGVVAERIRRTANRVLVSLNNGASPPDVPSNHTFSATYTVIGDVGVKNIDTSAVEYVTPGDLTLTFRGA